MTEALTGCFKHLLEDLATCLIVTNVKGKEDEKWKEVEGFFRQMSIHAVDAMEKVPISRKVLKPYNIALKGINTEESYQPKGTLLPILLMILYRRFSLSIHRSTLKMARFLRKEMGKEDPLYRFFVSYIALTVEFWEPKDPVLLEQISIMLRDLTNILMSKLRCVLGGYRHDEPPNELEEVPYGLEEVRVFLKVEKQKIRLRNLVWDSMLDLDVQNNIHIKGTLPFSKKKKFHIKGFQMDVQTLLFFYSKGLEGFEKCLEIVQTMGLEGKRKPCGILLGILEELNDISPLVKQAQETLLEKISKQKETISNIILSFGQKRDCWLLDNKDSLNTKARIYLLKMLLPKIQESLTIVTIDRSEMLDQSYEYIINAERELLLSTMIVEFRGEGDNGVGITREWLGALLREIFTCTNGPFLPCQEDGKRFYPNPRGRYQPRIYQFTGILIALALVHGISVSISLDKVVHLLLAENGITWEDIVHQEPDLHRSCRTLLDLDWSTLRNMNQTFEHHIQGEDVELCENGSNLLVDISNRERFCELLTHKRCVEPIQNLVNQMAAGFSIVSGGSQETRSFFRRACHNELDLLLQGVTTISTNEWQHHTNLEGFEPNDNEPQWFWQMVEEMSHEERTKLLFYWSALYNVPIGGFASLHMKFTLRKKPGEMDVSPSSSTCFFSLSLSEYSSFGIMVERFTQTLNSL